MYAARMRERPRQRRRGEKAEVFFLANVRRHREVYWGYPRKIEGKDGVFGGLEGLLQGIS